MNSIRDTTGRKPSDHKFQDLLESAPDAMIIVNAEGTIVLVNSQTEKLFGFPREELVEHSVEMLMPQRFKPNHPSHRAKYFMNPRVRPMGTALDLYGLKKDGTEIPVEISLSPLETEEGVLVISAIRDTTERRRFERSLQEKNIELERAIQVKDRFLATMSHELRTPLNAITGFTGTLLMKLPGPLNEEQEKQLRIVQTSARHLLSLINDLLDLAQIESGEVVLRFEPVDCREIVQEVAEALGSASSAKGLSLEVSVPTVAVVVQTDRRAVSQILLNLAGNAIKYTDQGTVRIELFKHDEGTTSGTEITVSDTGIGIAAGDQARLFEAFSQITAATRPRTEGTGLGLYLSQNLAGLLGGRISFQSQPQKGSRFSLILPDQIPERVRHH